jgi:hypothetical protein
VLENARKYVVGLENNCGGLKSDSERLKTRDSDTEHREQARKTPKGMLTVLMMWQFLLGEKLTVVG